MDVIWTFFRYQYRCGYHCVPIQTYFKVIRLHDHNIVIDFLTVIYAAKLLIGR